MTAPSTPASAAAKGALPLPKKTMKQLLASSMMRPFSPRRRQAVTSSQLKCSRCQALAKSLQVMTIGPRIPRDLQPRWEDMSPQAQAELDDQLAQRWKHPAADQERDAQVMAYMGRLVATLNDSQRASLQQEIFQAHPGCFQP